MSTSFPFVIKVESIAGGSVKDACYAAVELSRHLKCMVQTEINDVTITVSGAVMTRDDAYESWLHYSSNKSDQEKRKELTTQEMVEVWRGLSDAGLRLRCGELTAQEIRTIRAVLNAL